MHNEIIYHSKRHFLSQHLFYHCWSWQFEKVRPGKPMIIDYFHYTTTDAMFKHLQSLEFSQMLENRSLNKSIKTKRVFEGKRKIQTEILIKSIRQSALINHLKKRKENQLERKAKKSRKVAVLFETVRSLYDKLSHYKTIISY